MMTPDWLVHGLSSAGVANAARATRVRPQAEAIEGVDLRIVRVEVARGFFGRARGLLFGRRLPAGVGLMIERTRCVHGVGMDRALDLVFIDVDAVVRKTCVLSPMGWERCKLACTVLEFEAGECARIGIRVGDRLSLLRVSSTAPMLRCAIGLMLSLAASGQPFEARAQMSSAFSPGWVARFTARAESLYRSGEDVAAIQAWETVARMDPSKRAQSLLRIGNVHQRNGRQWDAMQTYSQLLAPDADDTGGEARRKALSNLLELHEEMAAQAAQALDVASNAGRDPPLRSTPLQRPSSPLRPLPPPPASGSAPMQAREGLPRVEYLRAGSSDAQPTGRRVHVAR